MEKLREVHHIKAKVNMLSHFVPVAVQKNEVFHYGYPQ